MMKSILKEIALRPNKNMTEKPTEMLTELTYVKYLHLQSRLRNIRYHVTHRIWVTRTAQPFRHERRTHHYLVCPNR